MFRTIQNQKGQTLVEYLILVALMAVASIGVMRVLNSSVNGKFVQIIDAVQGQGRKTRIEFDRPDESTYKKRDMSDFMNGAANRD